MPKPVSKDSSDPERFFGSSASSFELQGCSHVATILANLRSKKPRGRVFLHGPRGTGKSHVLAALALLFAVSRAKGESHSPPVCFIPDMRTAYEDELYLVQCAIQTFIDQPLFLNALASVRKADQSVLKLVEWFRRITGVIFIADQCNEVPERYLNTDPKAYALNMLIKSVGTGNWMFFAASSNQKKVDIFQRSTGGDSALMVLVEHFTEQECKAFITHNFPQISPHMFAADHNSQDEDVSPADVPLDEHVPLLQRVREVTGFLPLFIYRLCLMLEQDRNKVGQPVTTSFIRAHIDALSIALRSEIAEGLKMHFPVDESSTTFKNKLTYMSEAVVGEGSYLDQSAAANLIDWRYFYAQGPQMSAVPVSELARATMAAAVVTASFKLDIASRNKYLSSLQNAMKLNPSTKGFIIENIVNECLKWIPWDTVLEPLQALGFPALPSFKHTRHTVVSFGNQDPQFSETALEPTLFIPLNWRYPLIDSVIVYELAGRCYVVGIQITTQAPKQHKHSLGFVTQRSKHIKFVPSRFQPNAFDVALLWIVCKDDVKEVAELHSSFQSVSQAAYPLENFSTECGVPFPRNQKLNKQASSSSSS